MIREATPAEAREWVAGRIAFIFRKTRVKCEEVFMAMIGRGFSETVKLYGFPEMQIRDYVAGILLLFAGILFLFV
jgi:hypothetical protein